MVILTSNRTLIRKFWKVQSLFFVTLIVLADHCFKISIWYILKDGTSRNQPKPTETTRNESKPPETTHYFNETTRNHLKPPILNKTQSIGNCLQWHLLSQSPVWPKLVPKIKSAPLELKFCTLTKSNVVNSMVIIKIHQFTFCHLLGPNYSQK